MTDEADKTQIQEPVAATEPQPAVAQPATAEPATASTPKTPRSWSTRVLVGAAVLALVIGIGGGVAIGSIGGDSHDGRGGPGQAGDGRFGPPGGRSDGRGERPSMPQGSGSDNAAPDSSVPDGSDSGTDSGSAAS